MTGKWIREMSMHRIESCQKRERGTRCLPKWTGKATLKLNGVLLEDDPQGKNVPSGVISSATSILTHR